MKNATQTAMSLALAKANVTLDTFHKKATSPKATVAKAAKEPNYTPEQTTAMVAEYCADKTKATVEAIALEMGRSVRSVVAKLSREKVYVAATYKTKTGEKVQKKDETADAIGAILKMSESEIESLTKATKPALRKIFEALANSVPLTPENESGE